MYVCVWAHDHRCIAHEHKREQEIKTPKLQLGHKVLSIIQCHCEEDLWQVHERF